MPVNEPLPSGSCVVVGWREDPDPASEDSQGEQFWTYGKVISGWDGQGPAPQTISVHNYGFLGGKLLPSWVRAGDLKAYNEGRRADPGKEVLARGNPRSCCVCGLGCSNH